MSATKCQLPRKRGGWALLKSSRLDFNKRVPCGYYTKEAKSCYVDLGKFTDVVNDLSLTPIFPAPSAAAMPHPVEHLNLPLTNLQSPQQG